MKRVPLSVFEENLARKRKKVDWTSADDLKIILLEENLQVTDNWHLIAKILGYTPAECFERYVTILSARKAVKSRLNSNKKQALDVPVEANTTMNLISEVSKLQSAIDAIKVELRMNSVEANAKLEILDIISKLLMLLIGS